MPGRRVGVFGGTFDPPHVGHLIVAQDVVEALDLDELRFVVAGRPPHKEGGPAAPPDARIRMVEAAVAGDPRFRVSRVEVDRRGPSWTVDTLRAFRAAEPDAALRLVIGADQLATFGSWREPEEVARLARVTVMARAGAEVGSGSPPPGIEYDMVDVTRVDVSSTLIRRRLEVGRSIRHLVPDSVRRIIEDEGLYAAPVPPGGARQGRTTC